MKTGAPFDIGKHAALIDTLVGAVFAVPAVVDTARPGTNMKNIWPASLLQ